MINISNRCEGKIKQKSSKMVQADKENAGQKTQPSRELGEIRDLVRLSAQCRENTKPINRLDKCVRHAQVYVLYPLASSGSYSKFIT